MDWLWGYVEEPSFRHFVVALCFAVLFPAARFILNRFVFRRLAIRICNCEDTPLRNNRATYAMIVKCTESMWKFTYYMTAEAFILIVAYHEPWFLHSKEYFIGWPNQELRFSLKLFYMLECGFYLYSVIALLIWETRRKDFSVMMSHHVISIALIGISYMTRFFRIGAVVLALHDASDVFMESAKVFKYSGKEMAASVGFGLFAISWFLLRLIFFPFWVIRSSSYDLCHYLDPSKVYDALLYYTFNTLLLMLLVFHVYWWILICFMIINQLKNRGQIGEDIRSDSEED